MRPAAALVNEDIILAGSVVMILSFLTVLGTLLSDLLLVMLDPRPAGQQAAAAGLLRHHPDPVDRRLDRAGAGGRRPGPRHHPPPPAAVVHELPDCQPDSGRARQDPGRALSFLGLGLRPPLVSWGVLLQKAQNLRTVALHSWLLIPAGFVVITVLAFNFLGDGLRAAADPYK